VTFTKDIPVDFTINLIEPITWDGNTSLRIATNINGSTYVRINFPVDNCNNIMYGEAGSYHSHGGNNYTKTNYIPVAYFTLDIKESTFSGVVTKEGETTPVAGATVTIRNAMNDIEYSATTDNEGEYTMNVVQNTLTYTATVTANGYKTLVDSDVLNFSDDSQTKDFALTKLVTIPVTISQYGYATFYYSNSAYVIPQGVEAMAVGSINGETLSLIPVSDIIPAGCAVILKGGEGEYTFEPTSEAGTAMENMLRGTDETKTIKPEEQECKYYKLAVNNDGVVGFYYGADDGAIFENEAHKAYLPVPLSLSRGIRSFTFDNASGIANIQVNKEAGRSYNLSGQRVNDSYKGVVILNGKKVLR
jgi:hypothetical protein